MPQYSIPAGVPTIIAQNAVYALPSRACYITYTAALEGSMDGTTWVAVPGTPGPGSQVISTAFVRCPGGAATVCCKLI